jgi:Ca2+-binding EF-hand superfamily protein
LLCLYNIHFEHHLITVIKAFASKTVYYLAHNGQEEPSQGDESSALLEPHDHLLPDWCHIDVQEYTRNRSWWTRAIAGHGVPNRQQALYWMDRKGPPLYLFILQFDLLFVGIFAAMQCMYVGPFMHHHKPHWQFVVYLVLAVVPILNIVVNKRRLVAVLTPVCSLGFYRRPQVIANVIRENKTIQGIRTFIVVYKLRRLAQQATTLSSHVDTPTVHYSELFDPHEIEEVAKVFGEFDLDGSGSITYDEFEKLMSNQGALLTKEQLHNMISSLDTDKSGAVDKEEFIQWYANHAQDDDISEQEFAHFLFHVFDENDSGEITIGEFKKKLEQVSKRFTVDEIGMLVNELDSNNDGTICEEEFEELIHKYYPKELSRSQRAH